MNTKSPLADSGIAILLVLSSLLTFAPRAQAAGPTQSPMPTHDERVRVLEALRPAVGAGETLPAWPRKGGRSPAAPTGIQSTEDDYNLRHVILDIDVTDTVHKLIHGAATEVVTSNVSSLTHVVMDLITAMTVDTVLVNGIPALLSHAQNLVTIVLPTPVPLGQNVTIRVAYHGQPPQDGSGLMFEQHNGYPFIWNLSEPSDARRWWPVKDRPDDKADSALIRITAPNNLTATSNGLLQSVVPGHAGTLISSWRESYPIAPYLISCTVGNFSRIDNVYQKPGGGTMPVQSWVFPEQVNLATIDFSIGPEAIGAYADRFGPYPFLNEKYAVSVFGWGGAMEHQTNTSYGWFLISGDHYYDWIYVHELSHQWWGDNVTCATWADSWLNEGFASWCEAVWYEHLGGASSYESYMTGSLAVSDPSGPVYNYPDPFDSNTIYNKGGWVVHMLRGVLGDDVFFPALADYRAAYQDKSVTTAQFEASLEASSGRDLNWFFQEWVYGLNRPRYVVSSFSEPRPGGQRLYIHLDQNQSNAPFFTMPVQVKVQAGATIQNLVLFNDADHGDLVTDLPTSSGATVTVDPHNWILRTVQGGSYHLNLITTDLPTVTTGYPVADTLIARGGVLPYSWLALDPLPPGINLGGATGILSGTPATPGTYAFRIKVTDTSAPPQTDTQRITWTIESPTSVNGPVASQGMGSTLEVTPNPAMQSVLLRASSRSNGPAEFRVFDLAGRSIATGTSAASGPQRSWLWNGRDVSGRRVPAGVYLVQARIGSGSQAWVGRSKVLLLD